jgi:curved DNA-binding protein
MDFKDYYKILGVEKSATAEEIKKAYRKLAIKFHPDTHQGDKASEDKFKNINEAYEVLGDADKRKKYDSLGSSYNRYQQTGGNPDEFNWSEWAGSSGRGRSSDSYSNIGDIFSGGGMSEFFEKIFGGSFGQSSKSTRQRTARGGSRNNPMYETAVSPPEDVNTSLEITLEEAYKGVHKLISINGNKIDLNIKPGIKDGQVLKIPGKGKSDHNGRSAGDLLIKVLVKPHKHVKRQEDDLYVDVTIDLYRAILGGTSNLQTFGGKIKLVVPPESQPGKVLILKGQGMPKYTDPTKYGDLYITLNVKLPENISDEEKELFKKLESLRKLKIEN